MLWACLPNAPAILSKPSPPRTHQPPRRKLSCRWKRKQSTNEAEPEGGGMPLHTVLGSQSPHLCQMRLPPDTSSWVL